MEREENRSGSSSLRSEEEEEGRSLTVGGGWKPVLLRHAGPRRGGFWVDIVAFYDDVSIYYLQKMSTRCECLDGIKQ